MASILAKAQACMGESEQQKKVQQVVDNSVLGNYSPSKGKKTFFTPAEAAGKFKQILETEIESYGSTTSKEFKAGGLGKTAVSTLTDLTVDDTVVSAPSKVGKNRYTIGISFSGDLHRDSLVPKLYDGVDNIAALLNNGYSAGRRVYGIWKGHNDDKRMGSLTDRAPSEFVDYAVRNFMATCAKKYGVINIEVNDIYE